MSNECRMTEEQFEALWDAVVRHVTYTIDDHENGHSRKLWIFRNRAHTQARRLLVEPEQQVADPDLTTFGELDAGEWFRYGIGNYPMVKTYGVAYSHGIVAIDIRGHSFSAICDSEPVRRLPKPEWNR